MTDYTTTVRAYNNIPFGYRLKKAGYYDVVGTTVGGTNVTGLMFWVYNGLNMSYYQGTSPIMTVTANAGQLPDGTQISGVYGCLAEAGAGSGIYTNYTKVGSPTVDIYSGEVTGFSLSNYIKLPTAFNPSSSPWEVKLKFKTNSSIAIGQKIFHSCKGAGPSNRYGAALGITNSKFNFFCSADGSSWIFDLYSSYTPLANTTYWIKFGFTGTEYYFDYSTDGTNYTRDITYSSTSPICTIANSYIGVYSSSSIEQPFLGTIYLDDSEIIVDNSVWWTPAVGTDYVVKKAGYVNYTKVGSPTVDIETGVASSFGSSSYLTIGTFSPNGNTWEYYIKFTLGSSTSSQGVSTCVGSSNGCSPFYIDSGKLIAYLSSDGSSWDIASGETILSSISANTTYKMKAEYTGTAYNWYLWENDSWTLKKTITSSSAIRDGLTMLLGNNRGQNNPFGGTIDLSETYINVDGQTYWSPVGDYNTTAQGLLPTGVTDDGSAQTWNLFYNNGTYLLNTTSTMTGYTWVGSVAIPAHSSPTPVSPIIIYNNFEKIGNPIIDQQTGVLSNCSLSNYIQTKSNFIPQSNPWEFGIKFTTSDDVNETQFLISDTQIGRGSVIGINDGTLIWYASSTGGNNWDILDGVTGTNALNTNTTYWAKFIFTGTRYRAYLSTTGEFAGEETLEIDEANNTPVYGDYRITYGAQVADSMTVFFPWLGTIDLSETYVKLNGQTWWVPYEEFTPKLYNNFTTIGSPIVNQLTGVVSGFSLNDYISLQNLFPSNPNSYEINIKVITPSSWEDGDYAVIDFNGSDIFLEGQTDTFCQWNGETKVSGSTTIQPNTEYVLKLVYDGSDYKLYVNNSLEYITNYNLNSPVLLRVGNRLNFQYWPGLIDLSESYIKIDGNDWWVGYTELTPRPSTVYNNFSTVGSPVVNQSTGVVNNFGSDSWLTLPEVFNPGSNTWEVMFKVVTGTVEYESHWVIGTGIWGQDFQGFTLGYEPFSKLCFYLSETGESWDLAGYTEGETTLLDNTLYYFKLQFTGTEYILSLSTNGINWNTEATVQSSTPIYVSQSPLAIGSNLWNNEANATYWDGSIDLSESYIKINGQTWWVGYIGSNPTPAPTPTPTKDYDVIGSLTNDNGVYSGFSDDDYIQLSTDLLTPGNTFVFKFTTGSDLTDFQNILAPDDWFEVYVENGNLYAWLESEGGPISCGTVSTETTYWAKVETTSNSVTLSYSTDGVTYTGAVSSPCVKGTPQLFNVGHGILDFYNRNWSGSIDITNSCIKNSSGTVIW